MRRQFVAEAANRLWVADLTYVPTWQGFIYLAIVLDVWSRRIVGGSIGEDLSSDRVLAALNMALAVRRPTGVIHHSDRGSQYGSLAFGRRCRGMGVLPSMGSVGDVYDNAMAESFFASLECELLDRNSFCSKREAKNAVFCWIEGWYNPRRRHSALGYLSPVAYEERYAASSSLKGAHTALSVAEPAMAGSATEKNQTSCLALKEERKVSTQRGQLHSSE